MAVLLGKGGGEELGGSEHLLVVQLAFVAEHDLCSGSAIDMAI